MTSLPAIRSDRLAIGISACLLGRPVYHDGSPQRPAPGHEWLADQFHLVPICPEMAAEFGTPRPPIALSGGDGAAVLDGRAKVTSRRWGDVTDRLLAGASRCRDDLIEAGVDGLVLRELSPSCGVTRTSIRGRGRAAPGSGVFTALARSLRVPIVSEGALSSPIRRQEFADRVALVRYLKSWPVTDATPADLQHLWHTLKLLVLASDAHRYQRIRETFDRHRRGQLDTAELADRVIDLLIDALCREASDGGRANALDHAWGHVARRGAAEHRAAVVGQIRRSPTQRSCAGRARDLILDLSHAIGEESLLRPRLLRDLTAEYGTADPGGAPISA